MLVKAGGAVERAAWDEACGVDGGEMEAGWGKWGGAEDGWVAGVQCEGEGFGYGVASYGTAGLGEGAACDEEVGGF